MTKFVALFATSMLGTICVAQEGIISRISQVLKGSFPERGSTLARTSGDGRFIVFQSAANNIVYRDFNTHLDVFIHDANLGITECMSRKPDGEYTVGDSISPDISDDGRFVVFSSVANNLVAGDTNGKSDVFIRDRTTRTTKRVSVGFGGAESNGVSINPRISSDGKNIVFVSYANNLVSNDTNGHADAFRYSMKTGLTDCVSLGNNGVLGNNDTTTVDVSGNGNTVAFSSRATNLVEAFSLHQHVYLRDVAAATTVRVSVSDTGVPANAWTSNVSISSQGNAVAFESSASNLVPGDENGRQDIFVRDLLRSTTAMASLSSAGAQSDRRSYNASISADGRWVAFNTDSHLIWPGDKNDEQDVFLRDTQEDTTMLISRSENGDVAAGQSLPGFVADNGRVVAFASDAGNIAKGDSNNGYDVFLTETATGHAALASVRAVDAFGQSDPGSISANGRFVAFASDANNLVAFDTNIKDIFVFDRLTGLHELANVSSGGEQANGWTEYPTISADGNSVAFCSEAYNLVPTDTNWSSDIFVRDRRSGKTTRVSVSSEGKQANEQSHAPSISADGRFVAFESSADNLVPGVRGGVYVHDRLTAQTTLESVAVDGTPMAGVSPQISADGRFVVFVALPPDRTGIRRVSPQVFLRDRLKNTTELVSTSNGTMANGRCLQPRVSDDGDVIAFASEATNLVGFDTNNAIDVFVRNRNLGTTVRASVSTAGVQAMYSSLCDSISSDGGTVYFSSGSPNLVLNDDNGKTDVFAHSVEAHSTSRISVGTSGIEGDGSSFTAMGRNPLAVVFTSMATNFIPFDTNGSDDILVFDRRLTPKAFSLEEGLLLDGALPRLWFSDDERTRVLSGRSRLAVVFEGASALGSVSALEFEIESSVSADGVERTVELYDFDEGSYEVLDQGSAAQEDEKVIIRVLTAPTRFVGPTGQLRARVKYAADGVGQSPFQCRLDHVRWTVQEK